jgi:hypothetical protein
MQIIQSRRRFVAGVLGLLMNATDIVDLTVGRPRRVILVAPKNRVVAVHCECRSAKL